jgi:aspartate carbamoyltransferase catalytic subunit
MKHLLSTRDLDHDAAVALLDIAEDMSDVNNRAIKKLPVLRGRTVVNLFFEDSTRTRTSFETAAKRLSADVINFSAKGSSVSKGESLKDTAQTLAAIGADAVVIRHQASGAPMVLAHNGWIDAGVVNAGDGCHEHPTQALLDAFTLRQRLHGDDSRGRDLDGVSVLIVGDILHSRVARSDVWLLSELGARVAFAGPPTLLPYDIGTWPCEVFDDFDTALAQDFDAVMTLRIQLERMEAAFFPSRREYVNLWGLGPARFHRLSPRTLIMHPGPMNRGLEICSEAADSPQATVREQVHNGVSVRMAVLYSLLSDREAADA